ncbi:MAG: hypothetical protein ACLTSG_12425 [Lachnospiraceae bacterium]
MTRARSSAPFKRIPYLEALEKYGTDKPDLRIDLVAQDATELLSGCGFGPFEGQVVKAVAVSATPAAAKPDGQALRRRRGAVREQGLLVPRGRKGRDSRRHSQVHAAHRLRQVKAEPRPRARARWCCSAAGTRARRRRPRACS